MKVFFLSSGVVNTKMVSVLTILLQQNWCNMGNDNDKIMGNDKTKLKQAINCLLDNSYFAITSVTLR